jgi:hypothetical protein
MLITYQRTWCHSPEQHSLEYDHCEYISSYIISVFCTLLLKLTFRIYFGDVTNKLWLLVLQNAVIILNESILKMIVTMGYKSCLCGTQRHLKD